jgi:hypothetical protein
MRRCVTTKQVPIIKLNTIGQRPKWTQTNWRHYSKIQNTIHINEESKDCYDAYFDELGIKRDRANEQIRSFELLQVLRKNTYLKYCKEDKEEETEERIKIVMERERYI